VPKRGYIEGVGGCPTVGSPCIGCTEPEFPDPPFSPFLEKASWVPFLAEKFRGIGGGIDMALDRISKFFSGRKI
jgi:Ni,Fe-hydrogenase I small subunit